MRIALYPLAPLIWWILIVVYYVLQYPITLTYQSDVHKMVKLMFFSWFAYPGVALINFVVFVTDPAVAKVVSEVRIEVKRRLAERRMRATSSQDTLSGSKDDIEKLPDMALSESLGSGTVHDDTRTDCSLGVERHDSRGDAVVGRTGALEDGLLFTTSASYVYNDNVVRRIRADGDANNFMDAL
ncbi:hypothetical protein GGI22_004404 [Coemansia erecta]|nr:hypothetical protein GGI22_004404 [Coemansia erecta]